MVCNLTDLEGARPKGKNPYVLILILLEYGLQLVDKYAYKNWIKVS